MGIVQNPVLTVHEVGDAGEVGVDARVLLVVPAVSEQLTKAGDAQVGLDLKDGGDLPGPTKGVDLDLRQIDSVIASLGSMNVSSTPESTLTSNSQRS